MGWWVGDTVKQQKQNKAALPESSIPIRWTKLQFPMTFWWPESESSHSALVSSHHMALMGELPRAFQQANLSPEVRRCYVSADVDTLSEPTLQNRRCRLQKPALCPASIFQTHPLSLAEQTSGILCLMRLAAESAHLFTCTDRFHFTKAFHSLRIPSYFHNY